MAGVGKGGRGAGKAPAGVKTGQSGEVRPDPSRFATDAAGVAPVGQLNADAERVLAALEARRAAGRRRGI